MQTRLENSELIELVGADAIAFAQSQFMSDVASLNNGEWQWSGALNPKGRLIAFFAIYRTSPDHLVLWLPDGGAETLRTHLQRFVFRSKVKLVVSAEPHVIAQFGAPLETDFDQIKLEFPPDAHGIARRLLIRVCDENTAPHARTSTMPTADDIALVQRWRLADLALGVPYIAAGTVNSEQFVPQWLSLERLDAFSLKKGCYPGQEIVARMHYLGQSKRSAFLLSGDGSPPDRMSSALDSNHNTMGNIVCAFATDHGWSALAVLTRDIDPMTDLIVRDPGGDTIDGKITRFSSLSRLL